MGKEIQKYGCYGNTNKKRIVYAYEQTFPERLLKHLRSSVHLSIRETF
jgi:hypothetical protein